MHNKTDKTQSDSKKISLKSLQTESGLAIKYLMLHKKKEYVDTIDDLAKKIAKLVEQGKLLNNIVHSLEQSLDVVYTQSLAGYKENLALAKFQARNTSADTLAGKNFKEHVNALDKNLKMSLNEIKEGIIKDVLVQASAKYDAQLGDFDFVNYKSSSNPPSM